MVGILGDGHTPRQLCQKEISVWSIAHQNILGPSKDHIYVSQRGTLKVNASRCQYHNL